MLAGLEAKQPELQTSNVVFLDHSVAKGGNLAGYRWKGGKSLTRDSFEVIHPH